MPLLKLDYKSNPDGYRVAWANGVDVQAVQGGPFRQRLDTLTPAPTVTVSWVFTPAQYEAFRDDYEDTLEGGALSFLIDLVLDEPLLVEHEAAFMLDSLSLAQIDGHRVRVGASLEVKPVVPDVEYDEAVIMLFEEYGSAEEIYGLLPSLGYLTNLAFPSNIPRFGELLGLLDVLVNSDLP